MSQPISTEQSREEQVDAVLAEYFQRLDRGELVTPAALLHAHPELEADLREFLDAAQVVECLAGPTVAEQSQRQCGCETTKTPEIAETLAPGQTTSPDSVATSGPLPEKFGRYVIRRLLGEGAMGSVYLARDPQLDRLVALKFPKFSAAEGPEMRERFFREARAAATLRSPNICPVYDVGTVGGQLFLSMAYIEGRSLAEELRSGRKFSLEEIALIIRKLATALQKAHQQGIVHRDLKPGNVMLDAEGEPVLMDFGLARRDQGNDLRMTKLGAIVGSPAYMSPEQVEGDSEAVGPASDVYSLGVVLYELLTGQLPFQGSILSVIGQVAHKDPQPPGQIRPELGGTPLEAICLKMMARKPEDRYGSMAEAAVALGTLIGGSATTKEASEEGRVTPASLGEATRSRRIGRWVAAVSAAALFVLFGSWAIYVVTDKGTLKIESKVDDVKIEVLQNGREVAFIDLKTGSEVRRLPSGDYQLKLRKDQNNVELSRDGFTMTRGAVVTIEATLIPNDKDSPTVPAGTPVNASANALPAGTIDLLARIQVPRDVVYHHWQQDRKGWTMADESLETPRGPWGVLEVPYHPPEEYELVAEVERTEGDGDFGLLAVSGDARFAVQFDGWADLGWLTGFGRLDGRDRHSVDTKDVYAGQLLPLGARRTIVLTVRKSAVSVECKGKNVIDYKGSLGRLSLVDGWPRRDPTLLQIQSYNGVFRIHKLTVRPLCETPAPPTQFVDEPFNGRDLTGWLEFRRNLEARNKWQVGVATWTPDQPEVIQVSAGEGALISIVGDKERGVELFTRRRWGDCRVTLEFLLHQGRGSGNASGVYLMGRYKVKLKNSYEPGKTKPLPKDCGCVFPTGDWGSAKPPEVCAEKPPGEWQTLEVEFIAPRFDAAGKKIADARFKSVKLNGQQVQTNVEIRRPDYDGMRGEESTGPLMLEGYNTNMTVAFRNIKVQSLEPEAMDKKSSAESAVRQLQDENADVRVSAALTLAQMGDKRALEPSLAALKEKDPKVRREAAKSLGCLRDKRALEPLISAVRDDDSAVRYSAASALGALGDARAVEPLIAALKDPDSWVRGGVASALAGLGDKRAVEPMRVALRRDDGSLITPVAVALAGLVRDESAVGPLLAALDHPDSEWTELEVFQAVIVIGPRAMKPLVAGLQHDNVRVRRAIVNILTKTGHEGAVEALISTLQDADGDVARSAAYGLAELDDPRALQPLAVVLKDPKSAVWRKTEVPLREKAASLGSLAASAPPDLAPLIAALEDEHWHLRLSAAWVLGRLGDKRATEALAAALKTAEHAGQIADGWMRGAWICAQALARLGSSLAVPPLVNAIKRDGAIIAQVGGISEADAWLIRLRQKWVSKILEGLADVGPAAVEPLIVLLKDENPGVRSAAAQGLGRLGDKRALDALKAALKDPDQQVRESAAGAIRAIESKSPQ